jgi:hypothetical protein
MLRQILVVLCLLACLGGAEMPNVGDYVAVTQSIGIIEQQTNGIIIEINTTSGLMTLGSNGILRRTGLSEDWTPYDFGKEINVTIGLPTIINMVLIP